MQFDKAVGEWGWDNGAGFIQLFLVRQMIARRLGFSELNRLFTGAFSSGRSQETYESGEHYLLEPLTKIVWPLVDAYLQRNERAIIDIVRRDSPAFDVEGVNSQRPLSEMLASASSLAEHLTARWSEGTIRDVFRFCIDMGLINASARLRDQVTRLPREEEYDEEIHGVERGDWLADSLLAMTTAEIAPYALFISENTPYSTQHGVKGEEYPRVVVVYDDLEASWTTYSFTKTLTPQTAGEPTTGQRDRGRRLAYVSFSRALSDLRVILFTPRPEEARAELVASGLLTESEIEIST
jgi:DNA helicase-2/ATP-dependent DNA helicase PcrA